MSLIKAAIKDARKRRLRRELEADATLGDLYSTTPKEREHAEAIRDLFDEHARSEQSPESEEHAAVIAKVNRNPVDQTPIGLGIGTSAATSPMTTKESRRRVAPESADFDKTVGKWMNQVHTRLKREGAKPRRGRKAPDLPRTEFGKILQRTDRAKNKRGQPRFPLRKVLSNIVWGRVGAYNQKVGNAAMLSSWEKAWSCPQFKSAVRNRFNQAAIYFRKNILPGIVWKQS